MQNNSSAKQQLLPDHMCELSWNNTSEERKQKEENKCNKFERMSRLRSSLFFLLATPITQRRTYYLCVVVVFFFWNVLNAWCMIWLFYYMSSSSVKSHVREFCFCFSVTWRVYFFFSSGNIFVLAISMEWIRWSLEWWTVCNKCSSNVNNIRPKYSTILSRQFPWKNKMRDVRFISLFSSWIRNEYIRVNEWIVMRWSATRVDYS